MYVMTLIYVTAATRWVRLSPVMKPTMKSSNSRKSDVSNTNVIVCTIFEVPLYNNIILLCGKTNFQTDRFNKKV